MGVKVLIIDDSATIRRQVGEALTGLGHEVLEAGDGLEGASMIERTPELKLVICDVNMPRMTGMQMLHKLRDKGVKSPPVVMLTTEGDQKMVQEARQLGVKGWLVKPLNLSTFGDVVRHVVASS